MFLYVIIAFALPLLRKVKGFSPIGRSVHGRAARRLSMNINLHDIVLNVEDLNQAIHFYGQLLQPIPSLRAPSSSSFRFSTHGMLTLKDASRPKTLVKGNVCERLSWFCSFINITMHRFCFRAWRGSHSVDRIRKHSCRL